ncbi:hypothetical protein EDC01DRAFT_271873 [Geopyxis carbonaria]|nr:hypothetical protein EDC01DRAFT_271873 [Geopyxis carbonaria]
MCRVHFGGTLLPYIRRYVLSRRWERAAPQFYSHRAHIKDPSPWLPCRLNWDSRPFPVSGAAYPYICLLLGVPSVPTHGSKLPVCDGGGSTPQLPAPSFLYDPRRLVMGAVAGTKPESPWCGMEIQIHAHGMAWHAHHCDCTYLARRHRAIAVPHSGYRATRSARRRWLCNPPSSARSGVPTCSTGIYLELLIARRPIQCSVGLHGIIAISSTGRTPPSASLVSPRLHAVGRHRPVGFVSSAGRLVMATGHDGGDMYSGPPAVS